MDESSSEVEFNNTSVNLDIEIIRAVLESGHNVELPATGYSMFPTLRPGDKVIVKPVTIDEIPKKGCIVVYVEDGKKAQGSNGTKGQGVLVTHRLAEISLDDTGTLMLITRGDSMTDYDRPLPQQKLVGTAVNYKRGNRQYPLKTYVPGIWHYKYNQRLLWLYNWFRWL